jgi:hypothetical protein
MDTQLIVHQKIKSLKRHNIRFGFISSLRMIIFKPLENLHWLRIGYCYAYVLKDKYDEILPDLPVFELRPLKTQELQDLTLKNEDWFFPDAIEISMARGDTCFGIIVNEDVACSVWATTKPLKQLGVVLVPVTNGFISYRAFTKPQYRGKRLLTAVRNCMMRHFKELSFVWSFNVIYSTNASSIASNRYEGCKRIGTIIQIGPDRWGLSKYVSHGFGGLRAL